MIHIKSSLLKKYKWGVAGCGKFSENAVIPAITQLRKSIVHSLYSNDLTRVKNLAAKFAVPNWFNNYKQFLNSDIEAVYIGSANSDHYLQVLNAAEAGKHILCEKPMSLTSMQANEMVEVCKQNNVQLAINYTYRFHPLIIKAKEILESQMLGKLVSININFNVDFAPGENFRFKKEKSGGGALRDIGTHTIDLLRFFGGEINDISGVVSNIIYKSEVDDFSSAIVKFEKSGYGFFNVSFNNKKSFNRIEILGYKGALSIENLVGTKSGIPKMTILLDGEAKKAFRKRGNKLLFLIRSVQKSFQKNETPLVTGYDGYINMKLMEQLEEKCLRSNN
jgi:predicted dehydrogenase